MNSQQFNDMKARTRTRQDKILDTKGKDYTTQNTDRLYNFKWIGEMLDIDPKLVCAVYMLKQVLALMNRAKGGKESEPILGRLDDVTNYNLLMEGLFEDEADTRVDDPKSDFRPEDHGPTCAALVLGINNPDRCSCMMFPEQVRDEADDEVDDPIPDEVPCSCGVLSRKISPMCPRDHRCAVCECTNSARSSKHLYCTVHEPRGEL